MTEDNKTHEYYIVKLDRPPHKFQEDTDIFRAGDVVYNATYLNPIKQAHNCYTQTTIKTVVHVQQVLAANIYLKKPSSSITPPNTYNFRATVQKGATKFPDCLHKGLLDEIIHIDALDVIYINKDGRQDEEEDSNKKLCICSII